MTAATVTTATAARTRGNTLYRSVVGRLGVTLPLLPQETLDAALAALGTTPETVTQAELTEALRGIVLPHLSRWLPPDGDIPPLPAGLVTTDAADCVRSLSPIAAQLLALPPDADVIGRPVADIPALACVPTVASFAGEDAVQIAQHVIAPEARQVQCVSHLRRDADGVPLGVSVTVQDISLQTALFAEVDLLYRASEMRVRELTVLGEIGKLSAHAASLSETLAVIAAKTARVLACPAAAIFLPDAAGMLTLGGQYGLPEGYAETVNTLIAEASRDATEYQPPMLVAFRTGAATYRDLRDIAADAPESLRATRAAGEQYGWGAILAAPLVAQGERIGVLVCYLAEPQPPTEDAQRLLATVADQTAITVRNRQLRDATQRQLREASALHESAARLNSSLDRDTVLQLIVEGAAALVGAQVAVLAEQEEESRLLILRAASHTYPKTGVFAEGMRREFDAPVFRRGPALHAIRTRTPVIVRNREEMRAQPWYGAEMGERMIPIAIHGLIALPFGYEGRYDAALLLLFDHPIATAESELQLIGVFADHAAVAMHNTRLYAQAQQVAALEERHRLARDLHDSVTQSLFSMSLLAQAIPALIRTRPDDAAQSLDELRRLSKEALAEMRALLFQLRPVALEEDGLVDALSKHVAALQRRDGPALSFVCDECDDRLPLPVEEMLFRVATEAINNALKHAHAKTIAVHIAQRGDHVTLTVRDDGSGFDPTTRRSEPGHLGLAGMRERVAHGSGLLTVDSTAGAGTTITVQVVVSNQ